MLDEEGQAGLREALLEGSPPGGGMWSGPKVVARWIEQKTGLEKVHAQQPGLGVPEEGAYEPSGSQALKRPGSRLGRARSFQKNLPQRLREDQEGLSGGTGRALSGPRTRLGWV